MTIYRNANEILVNTTLANNQSQSSTVALAGGGWVVTWTSANQDGGGTGIYQQLFDAQGLALPAGEQRVNVTTANDQRDSDVTALSDGGWIVSWTSAGADGFTDVFQQRYDRAGNAVWSTDQQVNAIVADDQGYSAVTGLSDGGWVITWTSVGADGRTDVYQRHFDQDGTAAPGGDRIVNAFVAGFQNNPAVTALPDGAWIVSWDSNGQDGGISHIYAQRFDKGGIPASIVDFRVSIDADLTSCSSIASLADGGWVVTWTSTESATHHVLQQRFNQNGQATSPANILSVAVAVNTPQSSVIALSDGGWVVTWHINADNIFGSKQGVYQQHFDKDGHAASVIDLLVNGPAEGYQSEPDVTALPDGGWLVTWTSSNGSEQDIHQQRFLPNQAPKDVASSGAAIAEGAAYGTVAATLSGVDANLASGDALTYTLLDNAQGRFALQANKLVVADGLRFDYEQATSHTVTVRATDKDGLSVTRSLVVQVGDVTREDLRGSAAADVFVGGSNADLFRGLGGDDVLTGGTGNDRLYGGLGKDMLSGGKGRDIFVFDVTPNKKTNIDTLKDFSVRDDSIWLDNAVFKKIGSGSATKPGKLRKDFFALGNKAKDANDYLFYDSKKSALYFDSDGKGAKAAIQIAILKKGVHLTAADLFVI